MEEWSYISTYPLGHSLACNGNTKPGNTLPSRHVSSCDVTRAVVMWEAIWHWILRRRFTLLSLCLRHVSRASMPLIFLLSHTFRETWRRDLRVECSSDVAISCLQKNTLFMSAATLKPVRLECYLPRLPGAKSSHEITWHDDMRVATSYDMSSRDVRMCPRLKCTRSTHSLWVLEFLKSCHSLK